MLVGSHKLINYYTTKSAGGKTARPNPMLMHSARGGVIYTYSN